MKQRQRVLPCGRVIYFEETTPRDIGTHETMSKRLLAAKRHLESLRSFDSSGRKKKRWSGEVYNRFTTFLVDHLVERLLAGDRVNTFEGHTWMIADKLWKGKKDRYPNWHTDGKNYGVVIKGLKGKFGIRLSRAKRKELKERINGGQNYHEYGQ
jgi:hypothetical protein